MDMILKEQSESNRKGVVWFPGKIRYKVLDQIGPSGSPLEIKGTPMPPRTGAYLIQYNESRGVPRRANESAGSGAGIRKPCDFCNMLQSDTLAEFMVSDLEAIFGLPYHLIADSRPFFDRHMLAIEKTHSGGRMTYPGFRDLIWILNTVFPGMRGNIGTGNQEAHLHTHIYDVHFPIEAFPIKPIVNGKQYRIGLLERPSGGKDEDLAHFCVESGNVDILARHAYWFTKELENQGLLINIMLAPGRVFIMPQICKTIGPDYPDIFDAFKAPEHRQTGGRQRYVGPVETAGIFLCYSRGNLEAMVDMYESMTLDIYQNILSDTGLHMESALYKEAVEPLVRALGQEQPCLVSFYDPRSADPQLVGGKGKNLHALSELSETTKEADRTIRQDPSAILHIPNGYVLTTEVFDHVVQKNIMSQLNTLDSLSTRLKQGTGEQCKELENTIKKEAVMLQEYVQNLPLPYEIQEDLCGLFNMLGRDVAVRSSANNEDGKKCAAAGRAESFLHIRSEEALWQAVKYVWASLYSEGFVNYRNKNGHAHCDAKMAVVVQKMVPAKVAGTVFSIVADDGRPAFSINANFGLGQTVVDGNGFADHWIVGSDAQYILESRVNDKLKQMVAQQNGGVQVVETKDGMKTSLTDIQVLQLAKIVKRIQFKYQKKGWANHVDVEFALSQDGCFSIVQTRPVTTTGTTEKKIEMDTVDDARIGTDVQRFVFESAIVANQGITSGVLQILGTEQFDLVRPGAILLTTMTTNRWDSAFHNLTGVITLEGNRDSHQSITSREYGIPAMVGANDALEKLTDFDGHVVTLDARTRTVYLGIMPVKKIDVDRSLWVPEEDLNEFLQNVQDTNYPAYKITHALNAERLTKAKAPVVTTFEGHFLAMPKIPYGYFQLDYYHKAWARLSDLLMAMFPAHRSSANALLGITDHIRIQGRILMSDITGKETSPILTFLMGLSLEDFENLATVRLNAFRKIEAFVDGLTDITASNVQKVTDCLVDLLAWMHLARGFSHVAVARFIHPQTRYIRTHFIPIIEREVSRVLPVEIQQNFERKRDREMYAIAEMIQTDKTASTLFEKTDDHQMMIQELSQKCPEIYRRLHALSSRYKKGTEDIRISNDVGRYLKDLVEKVRKKISMPMNLVVECIRDYENNYPEKWSVEEIQKRDPDLFCILQGYARTNFQTTDRHAMQKCIDEAWLQFKEKYSPAAVEGVIEALKNYPTLRRSLTLSVQAARLREYGHHLATRLQRKIAILMRKTSPAFEHILKTPENIFDITTEELAALFLDHPDYIRDSFEWRERLETAESALDSGWENNPVEALSQYETEVRVIKGIIAHQLTRAQYEGVQAYYRAQIASLEARIGKLRHLVEKQMQEMPVT